MSSWEDHRKIGNEHFGRGEWKEAIEAYGKALQNLEKNEGEEVSIIHANTAAVYIKQEK